jgi:hypothetical protein
VLGKCLAVNDALRVRTGTVILFGPTGNSSPHITVLMGEVADRDVAQVQKKVRGIISELPRPLAVSFGAPYREIVTGRYIFSDVTVPSEVGNWRSRLRSAVSEYFASSARMTEGEFHLTLGVLEEPDDQIDGYLAGLSALGQSVLPGVDISVAGAKGAKLDLIERLVIDDA